MLTIKPQMKLRSAREYFREHLSMGDYYSQGQKVAGEWFGVGAEKLGLAGAVGEREFLSLCEGLNPATDQRLTLRLNSTRRDEDGQVAANRRVFYDFTFALPKSVSVVALMRDDRILGLHDAAVRHALTELQKFAGTRVRKSDQDTERLTGNVITACFRHDTSRELDPHLHTHCVTFNATFDPVETRWKALEPSAMYGAQRFVQNCYFHELAKGLRQLGYAVENQGRAFRIKNVPESVVIRFSKRHQQIDAETKQRIEKEGWEGNIKDLREQVAVEVRKRKVKDSTAERLRPSWEEQLTPAEKDALNALRLTSTPSDKADVGKILTWTEDHLFERRSVVTEPELLAAALEHGRGQNFDLAALRDAVRARGYVHEVGTQRLTSPGILTCELGIVLAAREGRNLYAPLAAAYLPPADLSAEQSAAAHQILKSRDFITLFRGGAGTGKSFTLRAVTSGLQAAGYPVVVLAPQRQQVIDLENDGLPSLNTLSHCMEMKTLPHRAVVLVDEAGQVGGRQLSELIALVQKHCGRLILSGDTRQHGAVPASDALRAIEQFGGLKAAVLREIQRQNPAKEKWLKNRAIVAAYRDAVKAASLGDIGDSFDRLDRLGFIREVPHEERRAALAHEYVGSLERKERPLVVAQTWAEVNTVNEAIRAHLLAAGRVELGVVLKTYQTIDLNEAQRREAGYYQPGQYACFVRAYGRFAKGDVCEITGVGERGLVLSKDGRQSHVSFRYASRFAVAVAREMAVGKGDRLQLKFNGKSEDGKKVANGELVTVREVHDDGALTVADDRGNVKRLSPGQRLFNRGYAVTSYASQGKTVDTVLLSDASCRAATNRNQWYVSISRGRKRVVVFTENKAELRAAAGQSGDRSLALEMKLPEAARKTARQILPPLPAWTHRFPFVGKPKNLSRNQAVTPRLGHKINL